MSTNKETTLLQAVVAVGRVCVYCGDRATHADHIVPLYLGGEHRAENLTPACASCNCSKGKKRLFAALEKELLQNAFIVAPLVNDVAAHLLYAQNKQVPLGMIFEENEVTA